MGTLRDAAERVNAFLQSEASNTLLTGDYAAILELVWLAKGPADDAELVTEEWLRTQPLFKEWGRNTGAVGYYGGRVYVLFADGRVDVMVGPETLLTKPTRGRLRRLLAALAS